jgi:hypothetical protein
MELESNALDKCAGRYLNEAGVKWTGFSGWSLGQMGWNTWMEMESNGLEYLN